MLFRSPAVAVAVGLRVRWRGVAGTGVLARGVLVLGARGPGRVARSWWRLVLVRAATDARRVRGAAGEVDPERPARRLQIWQWSELAEIPVPDLAIFEAVGHGMVLGGLVGAAGSVGECVACFWLGACRS